MTFNTSVLQGMSGSENTQNQRREWVDLFSCLPADFNEALYREYKDLETFSSAQLLQHWLSHGLEEGRRAARIRDRQSLLALLADLPILNALEIGCFDQPSLEHLSKRELSPIMQIIFPRLNSRSERRSCLEEILLEFQRLNIF